jgi:hypothetical protein
LSTSKEGQYHGVSLNVVPCFVFAFFIPRSFPIFARTTPQWGEWVGIEHIFSLIFDGSPLWHGSNIPLTHGPLSRKTMATSASTHLVTKTLHITIIQKLTPVRQNMPGLFQEAKVMNWTSKKYVPLRLAD